MEDKILIDNCCLVAQQEYMANRITEKERDEIFEQHQIKLMVDRFNCFNTFYTK